MSLKHFMQSFAMVLACVSIAFAYSWTVPNAAYLNTTLPDTQRVDDLMKRLTTDQKIKLLHDRENEVPGLVPSFDVNGEALHGVLRPGAFTVFPSALGMAATWDTALFVRMSTAISDEARARYNELNGNPPMGSALLAFWSPVINMARDPRWGRIGECYGEDPFLSGKLGVAYVKGLQGSDPKYIKCIATIKHFAVYSKETNRGATNVNVNDELLREYYLEPFRMGILEGRSFSVMSSYTSINGIPSSCNKYLLTDILKKEWGFPGFVVTDCGAANGITASHSYTTGPLQAVAAMLNAGLDWEAECSNGNYLYQTYLGQAISQGLTTTAMLDSAVRRGILGRIKSGILDGVSQCPYNSIPASKRGCAENVQVARQMVRESMVLLKNANSNGAPLLPIDKTKVHTIAVLGPDAGIVRFDGYSCHNPPNIPVSPLEGIMAQAGGTIKVKYVPYPGNYYHNTPIDTIVFPDDQTKHGFKGEYFDDETLTGTPVHVRRDTILDFDSQRWNGWAHDSLFNSVPFSVRWTGTLKPGFSGQYKMSIAADDGIRVYLDSQVLLDKWTKSGSSTDFLTMNVQTGHSYALRIEYNNLGGNGMLNMTWLVPGRDNLDSAKAAALSSDLVIVCAGSTNEDEGTDRTTIAIPAEQSTYVQQLFAVNQKMVLVSMARSPVALTWEQVNIPAIVQAWWPGEEAGNGLADVLFGAYNPSGRLPATYYANDNQLLAIDEYDITKGRTYMYFAGTPLYPFGYGLSYTTFSYGNIRVSPSTIGPKCTTDVMADVSNTGACAGDEVAQLYIHDYQSSFKRPLKQLKGFARASIPAGQTKTVTFKLAYQDLACYDTTVKNWVVKDGQFGIMVGSSSQDIKLTTQITADKNAVCSTRIGRGIDDAGGALVAKKFKILSQAVIDVPKPFIGTGYVVKLYNLQGRKLGSIAVGKNAKIRAPARIARVNNVLIVKFEKE
jgi:beta-glucosidase